MVLSSPRADALGRYSPRAPEVWGGDVREHLRKIAEAVNALRDGKHAASGTVTLTANAATTTLTDSRISPFSRIFFEPTTANGAAEKGNGTMYVSAKGDGTATITHANNAQTDRTFDYCISGVS